MLQPNIYTGIKTHTIVQNGRRLTRTNTFRKSLVESNHNNFPKTVTEDLKNTH